MESQVHVVEMANPVPVVQSDQEEQLVLKVTQDNVEMQDHQETMENQEHPVPQDHQVFQERLDHKDHQE